MHCRRKTWRSWPPTSLATTSWLGMKKSSAIFPPTANTRTHSKKSTLKSKPAISRRCRDFAGASVLWKCYHALPQRIQKLAHEKFTLFQSNPYHPSIGFKKKGSVYTAEIGRSYRALARERNGDYYWFWIGTHEDYNK